MSAGLDLGANGCFLSGTMLAVGAGVVPINSLASTPSRGPPLHRLTIWIQGKEGMGLFRK